MGQQKARAAKKSKQKSKQKAVAGPPKKDPTKVRANLAQLSEVHRQALAGLNGLRQEVSDNLTQVHQNHEELLQGLNASEFNLRAHQKVLNAMAIELEHLTSMHNHLVDVLNETVLREEEKKCGIGAHLLMVDVPVAPQQGDELQQTVRRINWPSYHGEVESDLKRIAEIERERAEVEKKAADEEAAKIRREQIEAAKAKEESETPKDAEESEYPEGATVFGGEV